MLNPTVPIPAKKIAIEMQFYNDVKQVELKLSGIQANSCNCYLKRKQQMNRRLKKTNKRMNEKLTKTFVHLLKQINQQNGHTNE